MTIKITSLTKLYAVIGDPVEHSLSPVMQNIAFQSLNLDGVFLAFRVESKSLKSVLDGIRNLDIPGFNVTIPHKVAVMQYLDEVDANAKAIGAVNTVVNRRGKLVGYNTDGVAAFTVLKEISSDPTGKKIVLLGAGGAAKALAFNIASVTKRFVIVNRTESSATTLASSLLENFKNQDIVGKKLTTEILGEELQDTDILINATSVGMYPHIDETIVDRTLIHAGMTVFDIVYNPLHTMLLSEASIAGAKVITGVKMLVYQGALAFEIWTGRKPPVELMLKGLMKVI